MSSLANRVLISSASSIAPLVSKVVGGTQDGAPKKNLSGVLAASSIIKSTPGIPNTLAIS